MSDVVQLSVFQVALAYIFVLFVWVICRFRKIPREKEILISSIRMTLQLMLAGYALVYILANPSPWLTVGVLLLMETFAILTILRKFKGKLSTHFKRVIIFSVFSGTVVCLLFYLLVVVRISPWYDPQYFIPIAGMLIGNSMTGVSLGIKTLLESMSSKRALVEEALLLGAKPEQAVKPMIDTAFDGAIMPTIQSTAGMGLVFLPGMMTGQILSGTSPTIAIAYQIAIMLGILGAASLSSILLLQLGFRTFFNREDQLIDSFH